MSRRVAHNFVIIFHLGNAIAFFLHFTVLQRLNHLPTLWGFDWSSAELSGQAEKSICKETRRKFNPGAAPEATMAATSSLGVCPAAQTQRQPPASSPRHGKCRFLCPQLRVWGSFPHQLRASATAFVPPSPFQTRGQREVIPGTDCESCTSPAPGRQPELLLLFL